MHWPFVIHETYVRRADVHAPFGGQQQGGISTPANAPGIFIFTGHGAGIIGYKDRYDTDGALRYTGQGQSGAMQMASGNKAIRDHAANGKDLLVFTQAAKGGRVRFDGLFTCESWSTEQQKGLDGAERDAIVFRLVPLRDLDLDANQVAVSPPPLLTIEELRARALAAGKVPTAKQGNAPATVYERSRDVRDYVLARADGNCEGCREPAPFVTASGRPYLEAHHIRRLSDGGPDDIHHVAGICPNCHRRAHYGADRAAFNGQLTAIVAAAEATRQS